MENIKFNKHQFFTDGGHGWLKVPIRRLEKLGIADQITSFSYMLGDNAYLEEDCDLSLYLDALLKANGLDQNHELYGEFMNEFWHNTKENYSYGSSRIRNYNRYVHYTKDDKLSMDEMRGAIISFKNWGKSAIRQINRGSKADLEFWMNHYNLTL